ncbi:MAG: 3'-5' exonuclease [Planctomycetota bacterium]
MQLRIADTFTSSLAKLTNDEQKQVKITVFDLQSDPVSHGLQMHRVDRAKEKGFWSVRVSRDIRLIVHQIGSGGGASLLVCYVDHHDKAYAWAERRRLETHPKTGAAQLVELRETVREIEVPHYVTPPPGGGEAEPATKSVEPVKPALFADASDDELLGHGVPAEWLDAVRGVDEDGLLDVAEHLPAEAAEALVTLAAGGVPEPMVVAERADGEELDPFEHPDAKRRFRLVASSEELQRALDYPWDRWAVFLHPSQRAIVERRYNGPARVGGSAGTGKTVVALHRAVELALTYPDAKVLLTTFSIPLARMLRAKLGRLVDGDREVGDRISVRAIDEVGLESYEEVAGPARVATPGMVRQLVDRAMGEVEGHRFSASFVMEEWADVVDAWQVHTWEAYRDVPRLGRKTRVGEKQRALLWAMFEKVREGLAAGGLVTMPGVFAEAARAVSTGEVASATHAVVDEAQDVTVAQLRLLAALAGNRPDGLFFAGDLGQRIFQTPFSWKGLGIDVRGRSKTLKINYRTSHQIRRLADVLLAEESVDVDGVWDERKGTVSAFSGPEPVVAVVEDEDAEIEQVAAWLKERTADGVEPHEVGVFVRSDAEIGRAKRSARSAGLSLARLGPKAELPAGAVAIGTMHDAKGLEFRAVVVMACDEDVVPLAARVEALNDPADMEVVYETERHLLYVACTRARDHLLVTGVEPGSEFLFDFANTSLHGTGRCT